MIDRDGRSLYQSVLFKKRVHSDMEPFGDQVSMGGGFEPRQLRVLAAKEGNV